MSDDARKPSPADESLNASRLLPVPLPRALPVKIVSRGVCPSSYLHPVELRADGAMWCRGCDRAYYPQAAIWALVRSGAPG